MNRKRVISFIFQSWKELGLMLLMAVSLYFLTGISGKSITSDGEGYYDYLPSLLIHNDFVRHHKKANYQRINELPNYVEYNDEHKVNKYPVGTAILQSPFFISSYLTELSNASKEEITGYEKSFHIAILLSNWFYLFLGLYFLRLFLLTFDISPHVITITQFALIFATPILHYSNEEASFSHVYSFFAISGFLYFMRTFSSQYKWRSFYWAALFFGLIVLIRPINLLILLAIPLLANNFQHLKALTFYLLKHYKKLLFGLFLLTCIVSLQFMTWYLQTGKWLVYSYQGEGFNFSDPAFWSILFSYKKGLFVYTPLLFLVFISFLIWGLRFKKYYLLITLFSFFLILTYVLSSWWSWYYGSSYGLRAYIDFYAVLFLPLALVLNTQSKIIQKIIYYLIIMGCVIINLIQVYQYKSFILHWESMNKKKYWTVFLKTHEKYEGLIWKNSFLNEKFEPIKQFEIEAIETSPNTKTNILDTTIVEELNVSHLKITAVNDFNEKSNAVLYFNITNDQGESYYYRKLYLIHLQNKGFNQHQKGSYILEIPPISKNTSLTITLVTQESEELLKDVTIQLFRELEKQE